ncbi:MAG: hypothetical protein HQ517_13650, partial [SAR324 cluster bacterium]|nr:hypothetical protein [SAR324 cluster bacterium]
MKSRILQLAVNFFLTVSLLVTFSSAALSAETFNLKFVSEYPDKHPTVKNGFLPWIEEVKKLSGGRLNITFFNPNALV